MTQLHPLTQALEHPAPARATVPRWRLIASMVLAPLSFLAQIIGSYAVASTLCQQGTRPQTTLVVINILAIVVASIGFILAVSSWRATHREKAGGAREAIDVGEGRTRFMAQCGLWGSSIFLLAVILDLTAIAAFGTCLDAHTQ